MVSGIGSLLGGLEAVLGSLPNTPPYDPNNPDTWNLNGEMRPVVLDLDGDGIEITPLTSSNQFFDMAGDGYQHRTAWAGAGDGVLVFDAQGDGVVDQHNEIVFTEWDPSAASDMEALRNVFDTNHNGKLDSGDARFSSFKVLVTNADGTRTLKTFAQLGIASIELEEDRTRRSLPDGSSIDGETTFTRTNGTTGTAATTTFAYETDGTALQRTVTVEANGSTTIASRQFGLDGRLVGETTSNTLANGLTTTVSFDRDGDGVVDQVLSDVTVIHAGGSRTRTVSQTDKSGNLLDKTVTKTNADGRTITILRDADGGGGNEESETEVANPDGSGSVTVRSLNPNGTARSSIVYETSADGLTGTTKTDRDNDGVFDLTRVDATVVDADGSRTRTVTETNANGSLRDRVVTTTSADGRSRTIKTDAEGNGTYERIETSATVDGSGGSTITTLSTTNGSGALLARTTTATSVDGLTISTSNDADGDGDIDSTRSDVTVVNGDGSRTQTITDRNAAGDLIAKTVTTKGTPYNVVRTTRTDTDGDGVADQIDEVSVSGGVTTQTTSRYALDGSTLIGRTTTTTSADGLTRTVQIDRDGQGATDHTSVTSSVRNADGSATVTTSNRNAGNVLIDQTVRTTSANGLVETVKTDVNGDGLFDKTVASTRVTDASDNMVTTRATTSRNGTLLGKVTTFVSADRNRSTVSTDADGDGELDSYQTITTAADGSVSDVTKTYEATGATVTQRTVTTNATGLSRTTVDDVDGNGTADLTTTDVTVLNADGSRVETISTFGPGTSGPLRERSILTVGATGLSSTLQRDKDGNGTIDATTTDTTVLGTNGSRTQTVQHLAGTTLTDKSVVTTNGNGLSVTGQYDTDGDGDFDLVRTDTSALGASGSRSRTVTEKNGDGTVRSKSYTTVSADRKVTTVNRDLDGNGTWDNVDTTSIQADGGVVRTTTATNGAGAPGYRRVLTTAADGLSWNASVDDNGDGVNEELETFKVTFNADGSRTEAYSESSIGARYLLFPRHHNNVNVYTTVSGNGLSKTTYVFNSHSNGQNIDHLTSDVTVLNANGSSLRTMSTTYSGGYLPDTRSISVSADGRDIVDVLNLGNDLTTDEYNRTQRNTDGSTTTQHILYDESANLVRTETATTSANGRRIAVEQDSDGNGTSDIFRLTIVDPSGQRTDTISSTFGASASKTEMTTSPDGRTKTTTIDFDGDGTIERRETSTSVLNVDGSSTDTRSEFGANGRLNSRTVVTSSANGLSITATIDLDGDGIVDETFSDQTTLGGNGSSTRVIQTDYADGSLKSKTITVTSDDGMTIDTRQDSNGDGIFETVRKSSSNNDGSAVHTVNHFDVSGDLISSIRTTVSADGRARRTTSDFDGNGVYEINDLFDITPNSNGSYSTFLYDVYRNMTVQTTHLIDEKGIDHLSIIVDERRVDVAMSEKERRDSLDIGARVYDAVVDRDMTDAEKESYFLNTDLNVAYMLSNSSEFSQKYGALTDAQFVERIYQNALGRGASQGEMAGWLNRLGWLSSTTRADVVIAIAQSAEHLTYGNVHTVTNNTFNPKPTFERDHTTDKLVAADIVDRLFQTGLGRHSDPASTGFTQGILDGTLTTAVIAGALLASAEFQNRYGSMTDQAFVSRMFENAFDRLPTSSESTTWVGLIGAGEISRADFVVLIADGPEMRAANGGNDLFYGGDGSDTLDGGDGSDQLYGGLGTDRLFGGDGADTLYGGDGDDQLYGGVGADSIIGGAGFDYARYDDAAYGNLTIRLDQPNLNTGAAAGDRFDGIEGLVGGAGNDILYGNAEDNRLQGLAGIDILRGLAGNDRLYGGDGVDTLEGGDGDDYLHGGLGADRLVGGAGIDYARYDDADYGNLTVRLDQPNLNTGPATGDTFDGIEGLVGGIGNDVLYGNGENNILQGLAGIDILRGLAGNDRLHGNDEADTLEGGDGDDHLFGGLGADEHVGGEGFDYARYDEANYGNLIVRLDQPNLNTGAAAGDTYDGIEGLIGGVGNDSLYGDAAGNGLIGQAGDDRLIGRDGDDTLTGGDGDDHLYGGRGADRLVGGEGFDYARYDDGGYGNLTIRLDQPNLSTGVAAGDTYDGIEGVIGGVGNDTIVGDGEANTLQGLAGTDLLQGLAGDDTLHGGDGADTLEGGDGADVLYGGLGADSFAGGNGIDYARYDDADYGNLTIRLDAPQVNTGAAVGDTYVGIEGIAGGVGNDTIFGDTAANRLLGGGGDNTIDGRGGDDILVGGSGADSFRFSTALGAGNVDTISGFLSGTDRIVLVGSVFADIGTTLDESEFGAAADPNNFIVHDIETGEISYDAGGSGAGPGPIHFATIAAGRALSYRDFVIV